MVLLAFSLFFAILFTMGVGGPYAIISLPNSLSGLAGVIVLNRDRSPGYVGVDNPLYDALNCLFIPGDAAQTVSELVQSLELIS
jgi:NAD/NADP transhydrogenase beta subunit